MYDFIIFRGQDIKDLTVLESGKQPGAAALQQELSKTTLAHVQNPYRNAKKQRSFDRMTLRPLIRRSCPSTKDHQANLGPALRTRSIVTEHLDSTHPEVTQHTSIVANIPTV